jgi:hypothetical protein
MSNFPRVKKAFAIFFLALFLFNVGGFYVVYWGLHSKAKKDLLQRLDADNYSSEEFIVISIPISLPYPLQQQDYERVDGEFEFNGDYYNLVKQRLENDTLFMVCIKDKTQKKLVNVLNEYSNYANNLPANANRTLDLFGKLFKDFTSIVLATLSVGTGWAIPIVYGEWQFALLDLDYPIISPPPRV